MTVREEEKKPRIQEAVNPRSRESKVKSLTILALLAASALAFYSPGQKCNTNTECNEECFEQRWTVAAQDDGSFTFVCDPTDTKWYHGTCYTDDVRSKGNPQYAGDETSNACEKRTMCSRQCVLSGKVADDSVLRQQWVSACNDEGANESDLADQRSEDAAKMFCDP